MGAGIQHDEEVLGFWNELMEENGDVFATHSEQIFLAMKIAVQCIDIGIRDGLLGMEEFVDGGCEIGKSEIPLWEYLRPSVWIVVDVCDLENGIRKMLYSLLQAYHYTGYQAIQGFVYMVSAIVMMEGGSADSVLAFFRSLVPEQAQEAFDRYFQPESGQWKAKLNYGIFR